MIKKKLVFSIALLLAAVVVLSGCKPDDKSSQGKDIAVPAAKPAAQEPAEPTALPTPTVDYEDGGAKITVFRGLSSTTPNGGVIGASVDGAVPVTIRFNKGKNVWEIKGSNLGSGSTEFTSPECKCLAAWSVEFTVSGVFVPPGGLVAEPEDGCYVQVYVNEDWGITDATCNCAMGSAIVETQPSQSNFGPMKLYLEEGAAVRENESMGTTSWIYTWTITDLYLPSAIECFTPFNPDAE